MINPSDCPRGRVFHFAVRLTAFSDCNSSIPTTYSTISLRKYDSFLQKNNLKDKFLPATKIRNLSSKVTWKPAFFYLEHDKEANTIIELKFLFSINFGSLISNRWVCLFQNGLSFLIWEYNTCNTENTVIPINNQTQSIYITHADIPVLCPVRYMYFPFTWHLLYTYVFGFARNRRVLIANLENLNI